MSTRQRIVESSSLSTGRRASKVAVDWAARDAAIRKIPLTVVIVMNPPMAMTFPEAPAG